MGKAYHKEKKYIENYAKNNDIKIKLYDNCLYVETMEAAWKIIIEGKHHVMVLYHENKIPFQACIDKSGNFQRKYHLQNGVYKHTILKYLQYIKKHDNWRSKIYETYKSMPHTTKKQKRAYNMEKKKAKKKYVARILYMIDKIKYENETGKKVSIV